MTQTYRAAQVFPDPAERRLRAMLAALDDALAGIADAREELRGSTPARERTQKRWNCSSPPKPTIRTSPPTSPPQPAISVPRSRSFTAPQPRPCRTPRRRCIHTPTR